MSEEQGRDEAGKLFRETGKDEALSVIWQRMDFAGESESLGDHSGPLGF